MKRTIAILSLTLIALALLGADPLHAQNRFRDVTFDSAATYRFELADGSELIGTVLAQDDSTLSIRTRSLPRIDIPFHNITHIEQVDERNIVAGEFRFPNPNYSRYFLSPTAYPLRRGEAYYQNTYLLFNLVNYGLTDWLTIGGGFEIISTFNGEPIYFLTPKVGFDLSESVAVGGGVLLGGFENNSFGILYGVTTYGNREHNLSLGAGFPFGNGDFSGYPIVTLSGMRRVSRMVSLVSENWFIGTDAGYKGFYFYGTRLFGEKLAVDLGLLNSRDLSDVIFIGVPYVDVVVKF